jgi:hypothetical protein
MGSRKDMEIRPDGAGFIVYSTARWWNVGGKVGSAGGRASMTVFATPRSAMAWALEQFSMPLDAWRRGRGRVRKASLGDPLPKAAPKKAAGKAKRAGATS